MVITYRQNAVHIHFFRPRRYVRILLLGLWHWTGSSILRRCLSLSLGLGVTHGVREYSDKGTKFELPGCVTLTANVFEILAVDDGLNFTFIEPFDDTDVPVRTNVAAGAFV